MGVASISFTDNRLTVVINDRMLTENGVPSLGTGNWVSNNAFIFRYIFPLVGLFYFTPLHI